ncbi:MAG TPA: carboxypeptidase-like regulatory domain-containing protein [Burkholderiaceae bacterium]|nr:carboxypeptidase-like regulatory domain-containing protein [Burkholderiaceae bacterium]
MIHRNGYTALSYAMRSAFLLPLLALCISGCGGGHPSTVSGTVSLDQQPLATGTVTFHPEGGGAAAYGNVDASGKYMISTGTSQGLEPGDYRVTVVALELIPGPHPDDAPSGRRITPQQYQDLETTPLRVSVERGANTCDLALSSKQ